MRDYRPSPTMARTLVKANAASFRAVVKPRSPAATFPAWALKFVSELESGKLLPAQAGELLTETARGMKPSLPTMPEADRKRVLGMMVLLRACIDEESYALHHTA